MDFVQFFYYGVKNRGYSMSSYVLYLSSALFGHTLFNSLLLSAD